MLLRFIYKYPYQKLVEHARILHSRDRESSEAY
jgi:hypothetical protein